MLIIVVLAVFDLLCAVILAMTMMIFVAVMVLVGTLLLYIYFLNVPNIPLQRCKSTNFEDDVTKNRIPPGDDESAFKYDDVCR